MNAKLFQQLKKREKKKRKEKVLCQSSAPKVHCREEVVVIIVEIHTNICMHWLI